VTIHVLNIPAIRLAIVLNDLLPYALIALFLLVLVILFSGNWLFRLIRLRYISLIYGKFSHEFLNFFKDNNLLSPYNSCIKDEITSHFLVFYRRIKNSQEFQTITPIDYGEIPFMAGCKYLFKRKGNPDCINVTTFNGVKFMVVGYNETLQGVKMKSLYFFLKDHFILGELFFSDLLRVKPENLLETFSSKYLNEIPVKEEVFYITDTKGNQLNYEHNGFSISVKYIFKGDDKVNTILSDLFSAGDNLAENNLKVLINKELLDRL
jgi:hypothetical protein